MRNSRSHTAVLSVKYAVLALLLCFFLFPFVFMVSRSLMTNDEVNFFVHFFPERLDFGAYKNVFNPKMVYWLGNTLLISILNVVGITLSSSLCAYGFAKLKFRGSNALFAVVLATIMLPAISMQIPLYVIYTKLGWVGTWNPLVVPAFFGGGAVNIFLIRQFMKGIPDQLNEAAKIDGANKFRIWWNLMIPLSLPILCYVMVTTFMGVWNDFMTPLMYLSTAERKYTLSLGLYFTYKANMSSTTFANSQMAAGVIMIIPCMILFFVFQKQLIGSVVLSGIKG